MFDWVGIFTYNESKFDLLIKMFIIKVVVQVMMDSFFKTFSINFEKVVKILLFVIQIIVIFVTMFMFLVRWEVARYIR